MASTNRKKAAEQRAQALGGRDERFISALEIERQGYVTRGLDDRVAQVDEQLAHYGKPAPAKPAEPAVETA